MYGENKNWKAIIWKEKCAKILETCRKNFSTKDVYKVY